MSHRPAFLLDIPLSVLDAWWLEVGCCGHTMLLPCRMLARQRGGNFTLGEVLGLPRCRRCGMRTGLATRLIARTGGWRIAITLPNAVHEAG
jgi:hypothetical protein